MKCIKNVKTGNIIRVDDKQANQMVGLTWKFVPKSEWRGIVKEEVSVGHDQGGSYEIKTEKKSKKKVS